MQEDLEREPSDEHHATELAYQDERGTWHPYLAETLPELNTDTWRVFPDGRRKSLYLHTSPEFACKKLLRAGERRIFTFSQVYRNREQGALNAPEDFHKPSNKAVER